MILASCSIKLESFVCIEIISIPLPVVKSVELYLTRLLWTSQEISLSTFPECGIQFTTIRTLMQTTVRKRHLIKPTCYFHFCFPFCEFLDGLWAPRLARRLSLETRRTSLVLRHAQRVFFCSHYLTLRWHTCTVVILLLFPFFKTIVLIQTFYQHKHSVSHFQKLFPFLVASSLVCVWWFVLSIANNSVTTVGQWWL